MSSLHAHINAACACCIFRCPDKTSGDKTSTGNNVRRDKTSKGNNIWRDKTSGGTKHLEGQNIRRDKNIRQQNDRRDKTSVGTKYPGKKHLSRKKFPHLISGKIISDVGNMISERIFFNIIGGEGTGRKSAKQL
jgi:hypothetical protein